MINLIISFIIIIFINLFNYLSSSPTEPVKHTYVGSAWCGICHSTVAQGKQYQIWQNSKHSHAYEALLTPAADSIAAARGHQTPAAKTEACLKCHATGYNLDSTMLGKKFKVEDGVQCETCHGPGSDYKLYSIMKNRQEAIKNGLIIHSNEVSWCLTCHNSESPTFVSFNYSEFWDKIKHPLRVKDN